MNQNPNEYNPYAPPPPGPSYPSAPNSGYGGPPSGPNYPPVPNSGYSGPPSGPNYTDPTMPSSDPSSGPYGGYTPAPGVPTSYGPYGDPTAPPPPPPSTPNYGAPNYATPSYPPVPPARPPARPRRGRTGLIVAVALLVIVAGSIIGVVAYNNNQTAIRNNNNATATAQVQATQQAQVTATAGSFATATTIASTFPFFPHQVINDPLSNNSNAAKYGWQTDKLCAFAGNSYQVTDDQKNTYASCAGLHTNFTDFTMQVDVTMKQGDSQSASGLFFHANSDKSQGYIFEVDQQGGYTLWIATDPTAGNSRTLKSGSVSNFTAGVGQTNTLAVVFRGSQISLYVGQQLVITVQDSTYAGGQIGFTSTNIDATTVMSYNNARVWTA